MEPPLAKILDLYEQGKILAAWDLGRSQGELKDWPSTEPRILAGRLATHLGAPRLGRWLHINAYRSDPDHPDAQYNFIWAWWQRRGSLAAWQERKTLGKPVTEDVLQLADYHGQCALILGSLRDFQRAEQHMQLARELAPARPWSFAEYAQLLEFEDRYDDALEAAQTALELNPGYPPAISATARCLQYLDRGDDALELLRSQSSASESSLVVGQLIATLMDRRLLPEAEEQIERYRALTPIRERKIQDWIASTQASVASLRGDYRRAVALVEDVQHPYFRDIAENLKRVLDGNQTRPPRSAELHVDFVRQHESTCVPAILTAISRFWNRPAEHLDVAEEICYDGTPGHSERKWADSNGWLTREFRVDWDSATKLVDRGIPFTLATVGTTGGHMQAVTGYDEATGVLFLRDPTVHFTMECNAARLFQDQRASGPRGMALVPVEQAHLLNDLQLPDQDLYDLHYAVELSLQAHDRKAALEQLHRMDIEHPGHRLTHTARRAVATYDQNHHESLAATDALLEFYPDDPVLQLAQLECLRGLSNWERRLAWLGEVSKQKAPMPAILVEIAVELGADARQAPLAGWYVRRALRRQPDEPRAMFQLAELTWNEGKQEDALELYRFASCVNDKREFYSQRYFLACRASGKVEEALEYLRHRYDLLGTRSPQPLYSLFLALQELYRYDEAFAVLEAALENRPQDGGLRLYAATRYGQISDFNRARVNLDAAHGLVKHTDWLAEAARQARARGDREKALGLWRQIVVTEPLDMEAHASIADLLSEMSSREEALAHIRSTCDLFPHHVALRQLEYDWTEGSAAVEREPVLREVVSIDPTNVWAKRELALNLALQSRFEEALQEIAEAREFAPLDSWGKSIEGKIQLSLGNVDAAAESFRDAIRLSADTTPAMMGLLTASGGTVARSKECLEFVEAELLSQVVFGGGVLAFRDVARGILTPDELLESLRRIHQHRPDLWHAWSALARHLSEMGLVEEALDVAQKAAARFSLLPRVWLDLSQVHQHRQEWGGQIDALEKALALSPDWTDATLSLCDAFERAGRFEECRRLLESAIPRKPSDPVLRGALADFQHRHGESEEALTLIVETLRTHPNYEWGWEALAYWTGQVGDTTTALETAEALTKSCPGEARRWVRLAEIQLTSDRIESALESLAQALDINDRTIDAYDLKAVALVRLRRFADAKDACTPQVFSEHPPTRLLGRSAWVDAERGDFSSAIRCMRSLVAEAPSYEWGWRRLAEWHARQDEHQLAMEAAERTAWLNPTDMVPLGWLGNMKLKLGDRDGAKDVFRRAMQQQPDYLYAGFQLFDLQIDNQEHADAERTLQLLSLHAKKEHIVAARVQLEASQSDMEQASALMLQLCTDPGFDQDALEKAASAFKRQRWTAELGNVLEKALAEPAWHGAVPTMLVKAAAGSRRYGSIKQLRRFVQMGEPGRQAILALLIVMGEDADRAVALGRMADAARVRRRLMLVRFFCRKWRATDDKYWGRVGYVFSCLGKSAAVIRWMKGWRIRSNVESWMLYNLAGAYLSEGRYRSARSTLRHVVEHLMPKTAVDPQLALWCTIGAFLDNDLPLADRLLHETPEDIVPEGDRRLLELIVTVREILSGPRRRSSLTRDRKRKIGSIEASYLENGFLPTKRLSKLALLKVARHTHRPWMMWQKWRSLHPRIANTIGIFIACCWFTFLVIVFG